jgi:hypothetical protein
MAEYSRIARGSFTTAATPITQIVNLPFQPTRVTLENVTAHITPAQYATTTAFWDIAMGQGVADQEYISAAAFPWVESADYVATGGISTFGLLGATNAGLSLQYGPQIQIVSIAKASPTVIVLTGAAGFSVGQVVILEGLFQSATTGMPQMSNIPFVITAIGTSGANQTITVTWNSNQSNYTALSASPAGAYVRQVLFPWNYLPGQNAISAITTGATTTITTTSNHNYVVGQEIAFRIPSAWGTTQLNSLPNNQIPGSPIYGYVTSVTSNTVFVCNINSTGFTAFNTNPTVAQTVGLTPPQVVAVGDVNSGGWPYTGGSLYPAPQFPTFTGGVATINGPAIEGGFVNNTAQGFTVGLGGGAAAITNSASAPLLAASSLYVWTAMFFDLG